MRQGFNYKRITKLAGVDVEAHFSTVAFTTFGSLRYFFK